MVNDRTNLNMGQISFLEQDNLLNIKYDLI